MDKPDMFDAWRAIAVQALHGQWPTTSWPVPPDGNAALAPTKAWLRSFEALIDSAEALRKMQLQTIHHARKRATQLAKALDDAHTPGPAATTALQSFAQENLVEAVQYWSAYRQIVLDAELHLLDGAREIAAPDAPASQATSHGSSHRPKAAHAATRHARLH